MKDEQKQHLIDMMQKDEELGLYDIFNDEKKKGVKELIDKHKQDEEEVYTLTLKGLLSLTISNDQEVNNTLDSIELYLRRHYSNGGCPAIIFDEDKFHFTTVTKQE